MGDRFGMRDAGRDVRLRRWGVGPPMRMPTYTEIAKQFGDLIAKPDYAAAHALLTVEAQAANTPGDFKEAVEGMTTYAPGPIQDVQVMEDYILEDWPDKQDGDVAIAYVALTGDGFSEAITVALVQHSSGFRIRHLEWGDRDPVA